MGPLKTGKCFKWNYGNDVLIVWAGLMSLAAAAILNALHLRKTPPVPLQKDQKKLLELFDPSHGAPHPAKRTAQVWTLCSSVGLAALVLQHQHRNGLWEG